MMNTKKALIYTLAALLVCAPLPAAAAEEVPAEAAAVEASEAAADAEGKSLIEILRERRAAQAEKKAAEAQQAKAAEEKAAKEAADTAAKDEASKDASTSSDALQTFLANREAKKAAEAEEASAETEKMEKKEAQDTRYTLLLTDSGYDYYLDGRATRWAQLPHGGEQIIDTWVKLVPSGSMDAAQDGSYSYPPKYYLAHYYIRPKAQQIQFLSELEVTGGRPDNTVKGRGYQAQNWEDLIPDSIEDEIYRGVVAHIKQQKKKKSLKSVWKQIVGDDGPQNVHDALEEYFRISL